MPYTVQELISHIEKLFVGGMCWENYGDWHLDHIIPISLFTFNSYDHPEFKECWALSNLQPLWSTSREIDGVLHIGNLNKNNRI